MEHQGQRQTFPTLGRALSALPRSPLAALSTHPITHFLQTRRGYCTQFATAMVMMARAEGIPARMAGGFLGDSNPTEANGSFKVLRADAHTWPELWINGMGWTRFEPTPGFQSGQAPAYIQLDPLTDDGNLTQSVEDTPTTPPTTPPVTPQGGGNWWDGTVAFLQDAWPILLRAFLVVVAVALLGSVVTIAGRRHREAVLRQAVTPQERIEGQWELLKRSLDDYGVDPPAERSPREMGEHYTTRARLDLPAGAALERATATLERSRYAPPADC